VLRHTRFDDKAYSVQLILLICNFNFHTWKISIRNVHDLIATDVFFSRPQRFKASHVPTQWYKYSQWAQQHIHLSIFHNISSGQKESLGFRWPCSLKSFNMFVFPAEYLTYFSIYYCKPYLSIQNKSKLSTPTLNEIVTQKYFYTFNHLLKKKRIRIKLKFVLQKVAGIKSMQFFFHLKYPPWCNTFTTSVCLQHVCSQLSG